MATTGSRNRVNSTSSPKDYKNNCGLCNKKVNKGIACDKCNVWFHGPCVNLTSDQLSVLESLKTTCWYCESCYETRVKSFELKEKNLLHTGISQRS